MENDKIQAGGVAKALAQIEGSGFMLEDISSVVDQRAAVKPGLMTALLAGSAQTSFNRGDTYRYDRTDTEDQLPGVKRYDAKGADINKDKADTIRFGIPSFGLRSNVSPADYIGKRKPGTQEFLTEADVVAEMNRKATNAFSLMDEVAINQVITLDTGYGDGSLGVNNGNYYTVLTGGARGAKTVIDIDSTTTDVVTAMREQRRLISQELERANDSASQFICICGDTFFDERYIEEQNTANNREIKFGLDLLSQPIGEDSFGAGTYNYAYFDAMDGIRYINYGSTIINGSKLIGDTHGYLIPFGASKFLQFAFAPATTRTYANTEAQSMYAWSFSDEFKGVTTFYESNKLFMNKNPRAIGTLASA